MITNIAKLTKLDEHIEESRFLKIGKNEIETFDSYGRFYPLYAGKTYEVELTLMQLDFVPIKVLDEKKSYAEQIGKTFGYKLFGHLKNGVFFVGDIQFEAYYQEDYPELEGKYIEYHADRIIVEFQREIS